MSRGSFSPFDYAETKKPEETADTAEKGRHRTKIDLTELERILDNLAQNHSYHLKDMPQHVKNDLNAFIGNIQYLYGKDEYRKIYKMIEEKFKGIKLEPATVGAFLAGCSSHIHGKNGEAAINSYLCAGSIQNPDYPTEIKQTIIMANYSAGRFVFTKMVDGCDDDAKKIALIYVNFSTEKKFPGFCGSESKSLKDLGIERVVIMGINPDSGKYVRFYKQELNLDDVKKRKGNCENGGNNDNDHKNSSSSNNAGAIAAVIVIIIVILLIFFIILARNRK